jgi:glycosyltransferase involved in cell wall biosynthesis
MSVRQVCIITESDAFGGSVVHTLGLVRALVEGGCTVEVVANRFDAYTDWVKTHQLEERVKVYRAALTGILPSEPTDTEGWNTLLGQLHGDLLIFPKGHHYHGHLDFLRLCRRRFRRVVWIEHLEAPPAPQRPGPWLGVVPRFARHWHQRRNRQRRAAKYADRIIAVSAQVKDRLVSDWGLPQDQIVVVRNGVRWQNFPRDRALADEFRAAHALPSGVVVFGMLTRLARVKGVDVALRGMRELLQSSPPRDSCLVIAGEGPEDGVLRGLAAELGLGSHVRFVGMLNDPRGMLSAVDAIVFSSRFEGLPLALLEGMAAGCLPIVTDIAGMREAVDSPAVGWVVPPEDPAALAAAMRAVLALDTGALTEMRERVIGRVREEFDEATCFRRILDVCGISSP